MWSQFVGQKKLCVQIDMSQYYFFGPNVWVLKKIVGKTSICQHLQSVNYFDGQDWRWLKGLGFQSIGMLSLWENETFSGVIFG